jgi:hypothetical protein
MNISSWLKDSINIALPTGVLASGERSYGTTLPKLVRVENTDRIVRTVQGNDIIASFVIVSDFDIPQFSRVWLVGANPLTDEPYEPITTVNADTKRGTYRIYETYIGKGGGTQ